MSDALYLGIDGGGTTSRARLTDAAGRVLGEGLAGSSNLTIGVERAAAAIRDAAEQAMAAAGLPWQSVGRVRAGLGLAGANVPALADAVVAVPFGFHSLNLASDAVIACLGAHRGADGAILILGTGSQGLAIVKGVTTAIGGWGFAVSDDGSGAIIGRAAIRAAILSVDGLGEATPFCDAVMERFAGDPAAAVIWAKTATPRDYGTFAPIVFDHARVGDPVATRIVRDSSGAVATMLDRLVALGAERIALMGGVAEPQRPHLPEHLLARLVTPKGDAMDGALALARGGILA
jgi:glucosamine kinase